MIQRFIPLAAALFAILLNGHPLAAQGRNISTPEERGTLIVKESENLASLEVSGKNVQIRGRIRGDVHADNCTIEILPGGQVDGKIFVQGGDVMDRSSQPAHIVPETPAMPAEPSADVTSSLVMTPPPGDFKRGSASGPHPADWGRQQFALLVFGLLGGGLVRVAAKKAAGRIAEKVIAEPGRCLLAGGASLAGLAVMGLFNAILMKSPLHSLWTPLGFVIATGSLALLGFGWLCGMQTVGDWLARKAGRGSEGSFYGRMVLGAGIFFLANSVLGSIAPWLGVAGLLTQGAVGIMGLGGAVISGLGRRENTLTASRGSSPFGPL